MNREEIESLLPHRGEMLLVDEMHVEADEVVGHYTVRGDEFFLRGHFPDCPIVPGVIVCEIMGQASTLLVKELLVGRVPLYTGLDNVRFRSSVGAGETITVRSRLAARRGMYVVVDSSATVDGRAVCNARLSFMLVDADSIFGR